MAIDFVSKTRTVYIQGRSLYGAELSELWRAKQTSKFGPNRIWDKKEIA